MFNDLAASSLALVDLEALRDNLRFVRSKVGTRPILAVVKANAYGHGATRVARALTQGPEGAELLGVAFLGEGIALREGGIKAPVLLLTGASEEQIPELIRHHLSPVVYRKAFLSALNQAALKQGEVLPIHLKVDTGMGRLGLAPEAVPAFVEEVRPLKGLRLEGMLTHFAYAGLEDEVFTVHQSECFQSLVQRLGQQGVCLPYLHIANSAAVLSCPPAYLSLVRPGLMLYGYAPLVGDKWPLRPVMQVKTRVIALKTVPAGSSISYGRTFTTRRKSRIATVSIGYADGYACGLSNRGLMIAQGHLVPVVGRVCMDMTMLDVTEAPALRVGDFVTVMGSEGGESIWADRLSEWMETHPYEVLCGIGSRVKRQYLEKKAPA